MCNNRHLFITFGKYNGDKQSVTLGDGSTHYPIKGIGTIEMIIPSGHKIRMHNILYVPSIDVSLFSTKQHMKHEGCYEHSQNNSCTIAFPHTTIKADIKDEIEFSVKKPESDHSIAPSFDEAIALLYTQKNNDH